MQLIYFDENKYSEENPFFLIGGIVLPESRLMTLENMIERIQYSFFGTSVLNKDTEFHGVNIVHGKANCKNKKLFERVELVKSIVRFLVDHQVVSRLVRINVKSHRERYAIAQPEYNLGLMLALERFCDYLEKIDDIGIVFGDYEKDEVTQSILDFSQFKLDGKTKMYYGRPLGRLMDTIYFTQSHHSRFLQLADLVVYLTGRYYKSTKEPTSWHERELKTQWERLSKETDFFIQEWPKKTERPVSQENDRQKRDELPSR